MVGLDITCLIQLTTEQIIKGIKTMEDNAKEIFVVETKYGNIYHYLATETSKTYRVVECLGNHTQVHRVIHKEFGNVHTTLQEAKQALQDYIDKQVAHYVTLAEHWRKAKVTDTGTEW